MSCLFRALGYFIKEDTDILRQKICNYLALNRDLPYAKSTDYIRWESNMNPDMYICQMRQGYSWGGAIEIQAFCELYNVCVHCKDIRSTEKVNSIDFKPRNGICRKTYPITWNGNHYEPIK